VLFGVIRMHASMDGIIRMAMDVTISGGSRDPGVEIDTDGDP
jgi:hypothetical protein